MKIVELFSLVILAGWMGVACNNAKSEQGTGDLSSENAPVFTLKEESVYDFGTVKDGEVVEKSFAFQNTGNGPLVISNITASCGCTTPEWPKDPIPPGGESNILVRFNTTGKPGQQSKAVTITANTDPSVIELHIKGVVEPKN